MKQAAFHGEEECTFTPRTNARHRAATARYNIAATRDADLASPLDLRGLMSGDAAPPRCVARSVARAQS